MKKLLLFVAIGLAALNTSCSNDDSSGSQESKLLLKSDISEAKIGESVNFTVTVDGKAESEAELYIDSNKITNPYVFDTEGEFKVVAKKQGFIDSNSITIKVVSDISVAKPLSLKADKTSISVGDSVSFEVTVDGQTESDTELYIGSDKIANPHVFDTEGEFNVVAKKQGFNNSNVVKITVTAPKTDSKVVGKWIPQNILVTAMGTEVANESYPHKATCDKDFLEFKNDLTVELGIHADDCTLTTSGADWNIQGTTLNFNVLNNNFTATIVSNTDNKLIIKANGAQFAPLVPILFPDVDESLLALLPLADITLTLEK